MVAPLTPPQPNNLWDFITVEGRVRTDGFIGARMMTISSSGFMYEDDPEAAGAGTRAESILIAPNLNLASTDVFQYMGLRLLMYRCEIGCGAGESVLIRFWRYRRQLNGTGYQIVQATDSVTANNTNTTYATNHNFEYANRGYVFDLVTDALAVTYVYTVGAGILRAWRINWDFEPVDAETGLPLFVADPTTWPPPPP